jgi:hypothetical protein
MVVVHGLVDIEDGVPAQVVEAPLVQVLGKVEGDITPEIHELVRVEIRGSIEGVHRIVRSLFKGEAALRDFAAMEIYYVAGVRVEELDRIEIDGLTRA